MESNYLFAGSILQRRKSERAREREVEQVKAEAVREK